MTIIFVMVVSMFVYLPLIATFRQNFLEERLAAAQVAALAATADPNQAVTPDLEGSLLNTAGVIAVVMRRNEQSILLGGDVMPHVAHASYDLRNPMLGMLIADALDTLEADGDRVIRVVGNSRLSGTRLLEVTIDEADLYQAMTTYSNNVLLLAIIISVVTGILVYVALHWLMVRPMRRIKDSVVGFRRSPETEDKFLKAGTKRSDEIGLVERELSRMQSELRQNLNQKTRLAELGEAVAKINHDLRNILATAQLASDGLKRVEDPRVQKISKRLISAVGRAVTLCERTMRHGKADEPLPEKEWISLSELADEVAVSLDIADNEDFTFTKDFDDELTILADSGQIHRVILNLCRNAREVQGTSGGITIGAMKEEHGLVHITIADQGPGIPQNVQDNLFKAFSSAKSGGTGLGLAIARDIVLAHGGKIGLESTGPDGSTFMICLPGA
ncbi:sensor histidine kinase [Kordiimonas sp. SCSIO 12610]|uniref:sensor histidine kinase n=1 Tax=Kordiimonas sp. SCSIO 12610 TaxID=2829597 RepID=UPI002108B02F|nr:HAMP domain-containing sensor histidine kinase [Kordiimonas sp. SCSIO 12610]UTW55364.1 HAMP domain-containing histidine kinase [Kordiimonas sp. SCSIO 12610]